MAWHCRTLLVCSRGHHPVRRSTPRARCGTAQHGSAQHGRVHSGINRTVCNIATMELLSREMYIVLQGAPRRDRVPYTVRRRCNTPDVFGSTLSCTCRMVSLSVYGVPTLRSIYHLQILCSITAPHMRRMVYTIAIRLISL